MIFIILAVLKLYSKLVNNNLSHYFPSITPQFSAGQQHYNLRKPTMQLPMHLLMTIPTEGLFCYAGFHIRYVLAVGAVPDFDVTFAYIIIQLKGFPVSDFKNGNG